MITRTEETPQLLQQLRNRAAVFQERYPRRTVYLVLEGDWGGQIYLTVPFSKVGLNAKLGELLQMLDKAAWSCNDEEGAGIALYPVKNLRRGVFGGMGGGELTSSVWLHPDEDFDQFRSDGMTAIRQLLDLRD